MPTTIWVALTLRAKSSSGGGRVFAGHDVVAAAEVLDQAALGFKGLRGFAGHAVGGADVDGQQVPAVDPVQDPGAAADEDLALRAAGQPDDDPFAGRPGGLDAVFCPVPGEAFVDPVGQPQQGQLAQRGEVAQPEVVGQGGVDLVRGVDLAVAQALAQQFRGDVHQMDLVGPAHDVVRHRFGLSDLGDGADDVAEGRQVLDVDGGQDVDPGVEEFFDVLPAFGVAAAGNVGVRVFVHDRRVRVGAASTASRSISSNSVPR